MEIAKKQKCLIIRNSIEIWLDENKWTMLENLLQKSQGKFYEIEGRIINVADIVGIFLPEDLEEMKRRKNGQWKCNFGLWHNRGEMCNCFNKGIKEAQANITKEGMREISDEERAENLKKIEEIKKGFDKKL